MKQTIISGKALNGALLIAATFIIMWGMMMARSFINIMLLSVFISIISVHPALWLDKKGIPHWLSVIIVLVGFFIVLSGLSGIIGSSVNEFTKDADKYESRLQTLITSIDQSLLPYSIDLSSNRITQLINPGKILNYTAQTLGQFGNFMSDIIVILFIVLFILFDLEDISLKAKIISRSSSGNNASKNTDNLNRIAASIRHYLVIKTFTSLLTGFLITILLWIIGVDYAVLWGLLAFLLNYIPNIGSFIAAVPAVLFAWIQLGTLPVLWVLIVYAAVNTLIGYLVEPNVMGKGMGLSSLVVFLSLIIWGYILGIVGMFLSVPLTMAIKIILENNNSTRPLAAMLGTSEDAAALLKEDTKD
jgi:predicted PurR-regulated permease PerM